MLGYQGPTSNAAIGGLVVKNPERLGGGGTSRTQQERREQTRRTVLEATVASLIELGYAKTTTLEVQKRAGVSRGALLHHFPSKAELLTATIRYLAKLRGRELEERAASLPSGGARIDAVIDLLWESFSGPLFYVAMELRNASRTDSGLRAVLTEVELDVHQRIIDQSRRLFGEPVASAPKFVCAMDMTLQIMIGAAMSNILHRDDERAKALIAAWRSVFLDLIAARPGKRPEPDMTQSPTTQREKRA